ncbi:MAG: hypothetical protein JWN01_519 [Patescibacteria group bacterium]|nr:hypothetical protein [Patescibacteria group bacterium]
MTSIHPTQRPKRVVTKVGDVFETSDKKYFIQLATIDHIQLSSDVAAIYRVRPGLSPSELAHEPVFFYTHTTLSAGVKQGLWSKIGRSAVQDISRFRFKTYFGPDESEVMKNFTPKARHHPHWAMWTPVDTEWQIISEKKGIKLDAETGGIVPAGWIIERINNDGREGEHPEYPGQALQPRLNQVLWLNHGFGTSDDRAIQVVDDGEWYAMGEFSIYDAYDRSYNKTKPFYKKPRGNKDGDMGYMSEFIACSPGFPNVAGNYIESDGKLPFIIVAKPNTEAIIETLRLKVGHQYFKTLRELRNHIAQFAEVGEIDFQLEQMIESPES